MKDNRIVCDLTKVQWARFGYRNQHGDFRHKFPPWPTVNNQYFETSDKVFGCECMSMLDYAVSENLLDAWIPEVKLKVTANCILVYTGDKAISIYKEFCSRQFNKKKGKK